MFHPDLRLLRSFGAVAAELSVTRAAERLHLTQPTVSGQIKELERALGFALFRRTTRSVALTRDGERLLPIVQRILAETEALRVEVEGMQTTGASRFRLGAAMYTMDFPERAALLEDFAADMPEVGFVIDNRLQSSQTPALTGEGLDVSLLLGLPFDDEGMNAPRADSAIINESQYPDTLERIVLRRRHMNLLVPAGSPLAALPVIRGTDLDGVAVAMLTYEHGHALIDPIAVFLRERGAQLIRIAEGNAIAATHYAARHGICAIGLGWFPSPPELVSREVEGMDFHMDFAVVLGANANRAARRFFDYARDWQAARAAQGASIAA